MTNTIHPFELTNACICYKVDEEGEAVLDSYGEPVPSDYCYGCFDEEVENLKYCVIGEWLDLRGIADGSPLMVRGSGMGWTNASGWTIVPANTKSIVEALSINTEWTLRFRLDEDTNNLIAVRSSHDELGARFEFSPAESDSFED
jgi:hypothetical protein